MRRPPRTPWIWWYVLIPLREHVWYPIKRAWYYGFLCGFLRSHSWRPGGIMSAEHGKLQICDRCGETEWRLQDNLDDILVEAGIKHDGKHECVCVSDPGMRPCSICDDTGRCY